MPHIHTEPGQNDFTTTAMIVRYDNGEPKTLVHMHKTLGILLPVGGHIELDESPWAGVLHEIEEESGYEPKQLMVMQPAKRVGKMDGVKTHPVPLFLQTHEFKKYAGHSHIDMGFLFVTDEMPANRPHDGESSDVRWLNHREIIENLTHMPPDAKQIYEFIFDVALHSWEKLPITDFDV
jgi:hypothetical protein